MINEVAQSKWYDEYKIIAEGILKIEISCDGGEKGEAEEKKKLHYDWIITEYCNSFGLEQLTHTLT